MGKLSWGLSLFVLVLIQGGPSRASGGSDSGAGDCPSVDLRSRHPMPVRDQGKVSWCYAYASADYLQFFYRTPEQVSAADIAIRYNQGLWPRMTRVFSGAPVPETGFARNALLIASKEGYCPERMFPSDSWRKVHANGVESKPLNEAIQDIKQLHQDVRSGKIRGASDLPFFYEFPAVGAGEFFEVLQERRWRHVLNRLRESACLTARKSYPRTPVRVSMVFNLGRPFARIQESLLSGNPVSADYFAGVLKTPERYRQSLSELHTTLILGQRYSNERKECEYLIKDSHGPDCTQYSPEWECESGHLWVGEEALKGALVSTVFLQEK